MLNKMSLRLQVSYLEGVIPPRCRKAREEKRTAEVEVSLAEVDPAAAPVAIVTEVEGGWLPIGVDEARREYRFFDGRLWLPVCRGTRGEEPARLGREEFAAHAPELFGTDRTQHDSLEEARRRLARKGGEFCVIGEVVYREADEPLWVPRTYGLGFNHGGTALVEESVPWAKHNGCEHDCFSLLEFQEAVAETERIARERGDTDSVPARVGANIEVLLPEAVRFSGKKARRARLEAEIAELEKQATELARAAAAKRAALVKLY